MKLEDYMKKHIYLASPHMSDEGYEQEIKKHFKEIGKDK